MFSGWLITREGCFQGFYWGGLHVAGLINQAFNTVFRNHFLYLQLPRVWNYNLLADILDESVSLLSLGEIWTISFASRISKAFITCMVMSALRTLLYGCGVLFIWCRAVQSLSQIDELLHTFFMGISLWSEGWIVFQDGTEHLFYPQAGEDLRFPCRSGHTDDDWILIPSVKHWAYLWWWWTRLGLIK